MEVTRTVKHQLIKEYLLTEEGRQKIRESSRVLVRGRLETAIGKDEAQKYVVLPKDDFWDLVRNHDQTQDCSLAEAMHDLHDRECSTQGHPHPLLGLVGV